MLQQVLSALTDPGDAVYWSDSDGAVTYANARAAQLLDPETNLVTLRSLRRIEAEARGSGERQATAQIGGRDEDIWLDVTATAIDSGDTGNMAVLCVAREHVEHRDSGVDSETLLMIMEVLPDIVFAKRTDGTFIAANRATAEIMKAKTPRALIGKTDFDFYPSDLAQRYRDDEIALLQSGETQILEQPNWRQDGTRGMMCSLKVPVRNDNGEIVAYVGHGRDITEERAAEYELRQREQELKEAQLLAGMGSATWTVGRGSIAVSLGLRRLLAYPDNENPSPRALLRRFTLHDRILLMRATAEVAETGERQEFVLETSSSAPCGKRTIETTLRRGNNFEGEPVVFAAFHDITEATEAKKKLETQAFTDSLTGIGNRAEFFRTGERMVQSLDRSSDRTLSLILIDLDAFKPINDTHGHGVGDRVLKDVAKRLVAMVRTGDLVTRLGGDEFAILLDHETGNGRANRIADLCLEALRLPIEIDNLELNVSASIGVRLEIPEGESIEVSLAYADKAMYRVKANGRNGIDLERERRSERGRLSA